MDLCENNTFCMEYDITTSKLFEDEHELYTSNSKKGLVLVCKVGVFFVVKNLQTLLVLWEDHCHYFTQRRHASKIEVQEQLIYSASLVPRPSQCFSMLRAEKSEKAWCILLRNDDVEDAV